MPPRDLDGLLADTAFVRRIARALVRDPHAADDLAQDALVVALERPPREGTSLRGWIAAVVRTLAIDRGRKAEARRHSESRVHAREPAPAPDEIIARLDLSRRVAGALRELAEPYRTALYLRYVEDLDPAAIAARLGVPVATAKTRLRRGLEMLRARFDREWGDRGTWSALLVPLAAPPAHPVVGAGVLFMSTMVKIAAAVCFLGAAAWMLWPDRPTRSPVMAVALPAAHETELAAAKRDEPARQPMRSSAVEADSAHMSELAPHSVRVLDEHRFPQPGVHVLLHVPGLGQDLTTTDAQGTARFVKLPNLDGKDRKGTMLAWDDTGRVAAGRFSIRVSPVTTFGFGPPHDPRMHGELLLRPGGSLDVQVRTNTGTAAGTRVWIELGIHRSIVLDATADAGGHARFDHVPSEPVVVRAATEGREGRVEAVLAAHRNTQLSVDLEPTRNVELTVVDSKAGDPIAGASVTLTESFRATSDGGAVGLGSGRTFVTSIPVDIDIPVTDSAGRTRIVGLPARGRFELGIEAAGYTGAERPQGRLSIPADSDSMTAKLVSLHVRTVRWPLETGELEPPPDGTELTLRKETIDRHGIERSSPLPSGARIEDGAIVATDVSDRTYGLLATAPDGSLARLWVEDASESGHPTSFRKPRRIDVNVLDEAGVPAAGLTVEVRNEGNNLLLPPATTDAGGNVAFEDLWGRRVNVETLQGRLGSVDLEKGDGRIEARLPATRFLSVRLLLDGSPALPASYRIWIAGSVTVLDEEPALGIVRVRYLENPDTKEPKLGVNAVGYLPASATLPASPDLDTVVDVRLDSGGSLLARVIPPSAGRVRLRVEPWDPDKQQWRTGSSGVVSNERFTANTPDGAFRFDDLAPGRYRLRDVDTQLVSEAVDIVAGALPAEVTMDMSAVVRVRGRVELPPGVDPWSARIRVDSEGVASHQPTWMRGSELPDGHRTGKDGTFELYVSVARPVTLRAAHPYLSPHPKSGSIVVTGAVDDVHLELVPGDEVQIPLEPLADVYPRRSLRVYAYRDEPVGEPEAWFCAPAVDGVARFSGLARGTWTLWIDPERRLAPIVVRGVEIGEGITRVDVKPRVGSTLRVHVVHAAGSDTPRIHAVAESATEPMLIRQVNSRGENLVLLPGLAAGTYKVGVMVDGNLAGGPRLERTIEFDGTRDVDVEFDARPSKPR